ncbi:hypothetical protein FB45DRAFT_1083685 [Roridomyces roridus]|uniref:Uncharacterized protein n=1 Tax=Roridomyces roridus TaxID=1738132 RepID=A0AAD7BN02_9AGAR|nr:hypothetical protein FB45DRAFT_1083685 [Roridomyces roridus]
MSDAATALETALNSLSAPPIPIPDAPLASALVGAGALTLLFITTAYTLLRYISPSRLTPLLLNTLHEAEEAHFAALEAGVLSGSDIYTQMLSSLQIKASVIRETGLGLSLSTCPCQTLFKAVIKGHSVAVLRCIWEIQRLKIHIEILKERQLRQLGTLYAGTPGSQTLAVRRRRPRSQ